MMALWTEPEKMLPPERAWVVGSWDRDNDIGFRLDIVRRIGSKWFNPDGARVEPPVVWIHKPKLK